MLFLVGEIWVRSRVVYEEGSVVEKSERVIGSSEFVYQIWVNIFGSNISTYGVFSVTSDKKNEWCKCWEVGLEIWKGKCCSKKVTYLLTEICRVLR